MRLLGACLWRLLCLDGSLGVPPEADGLARARRLVSASSPCHRCPALAACVARPPPLPGAVPVCPASPPCGRVLSALSPLSVGARRLSAAGGRPLFLAPSGGSSGGGLLSARCSPRRGCSPRLTGASLDGLGSAGGPWVGVPSGVAPGGESTSEPPREPSPRGSVAFPFAPLRLPFMRFRQPFLLAFWPFLLLFCLSFFLPFQFLLLSPSLSALPFLAAFFLQGRFSCGRRGLTRTAGEGLEWLTRAGGEEGGPEEGGAEEDVLEEGGLLGPAEGALGGPADGAEVVLEEPAVLCDGRVPLALGGVPEVSRIAGGE